MKSWFIKPGALLLTLLLLGATAGANAEQRPVPRRMFEAQGTMQFVDLASRQIVINNRSYRLSHRAQWYGVDEDRSLQQQLLRAPNPEVGFVVDPKAKSPTVSAVWLLPTAGR